MITYPTVTVLMPVLNGQRYLKEAVDSILKQSIQDIELLILDGGSTDNTVEIIKHFCAQDKRVKYINTQGMNISASLNIGIDLAKGYFLARMDADDISRPKRIETQINWLRKTNSELCGTGMLEFNGQYKRHVIMPLSHEAIKLQLCFRSPFVHPSILMKTELAREFYYDQNRTYGEDYELWTRIALSSYRLTNCPSILLNFRIHSQQTTQKHFKKQLLSIADARKKYVDRLIPCHQSYDSISAFSDPMRAPTIQDARNLIRIFEKIDWADSDIKFEVLKSILRYVEPQSLRIYYELIGFKKRNVVSRNIGLPLLIQTLFRISSQDALYHFLKRLMLIRKI